MQKKHLLIVSQKKLLSIVQSLTLSGSLNRFFIVMFEIREVNSNQNIRQFVNFQFELYKGDKFWVPPLKGDEVKQLKPETNPSMEFCDSKFWTAWQDNKCVGRIGGIINHEYNNKTGEKKGRISRIEFIDDKSVSKALIETAENWLRDKGMKAVHGPLGFNNLDNQGLLIEGFEYLPSIASVYHKPYYQKHFEDLGYTKENDWVEFRLTLGEHAVAKANRGAEIVKKRYGFVVVNFQTTEELRQYVQPVFHILNNAFQDLPYVSHFNAKMIEVIGKKYFKVLNPKFVKIIKKDERVIAFIVGMPSLSEAMQKSHGKLFPFGFYHILNALKNPTVIDLLLTGVDPELQSTGAAVILFAELQKVMQESGITQMETTGMFETNHTAISNWKNYEYIQHKRRRCFVKTLSV
jgi:hypothetical protein